MNVRFSLAIIVIALFGAAWASSTWAQASAEAEVKPVEWPDTSAGRWAEAYVEAYNTPGRDALRRFVKEHFSEAYLRENPLENVVSDHSGVACPGAIRSNVRGAGRYGLPGCWSPTSETFFWPKSETRRPVVIRPNGSAGPLYLTFTPR